MGDYCGHMLSCWKNLMAAMLECRGAFFGLPPKVLNFTGVFTMLVPIVTCQSWRTKSSIALYRAGLPKWSYSQTAYL